MMMAEDSSLANLDPENMTEAQSQLFSELLVSMTNVIAMHVLLLIRNNTT